MLTAKVMYKFQQYSTKQYSTCNASEPFYLLLPWGQAKTPPPSTISSQHRLYVTFCTTNAHNLPYLSEEMRLENSRRPIWGCAFV